MVGRPQVPSRGGHGLQLTRTRSAGGTIPTITGGASRAPAVPGRTLRGLWCWQLGDECRTFDGSLSGSIERAVMLAPRGRSRGRRSRSCDGRCGVDVEELGGDVEGCELGCVSTRRACSMAGTGFASGPPWHGAECAPIARCVFACAGPRGRFAFPPSPRTCTRLRALPVRTQRNVDAFSLHAGGASVPQPAASTGDGRITRASRRGVWCHPSSCRGDTRVTRTN